MSVFIASFFSLLGKERRPGPSIWWLISFGSFWITVFLCESLGLPGVMIAIGLQIALFLAVCVVWVLTPRKSSSETFSNIEKERAKRADNKLMKCNDGW